MKKEISFLNKVVAYSLRKTKRSRSLRVSIRANGEVLVSAPSYAPESAITTFVLHHAEWIFSKLSFFKQFTYIPIKGSKQKHYLEHKEQARKIITERVLFFNQYYKFAYKRISIKNTSTRWGSCSSKGNLNFNYKLFFLTPELLDYVVIHELCHLKEFNHGKGFWNCVREACSNYKELRATLKKYKL